MSGSGFNMFVSEEEVAEQRQRRQAEWDKIRKEDDPEECPEEETRSLFDQLQANKSSNEKEYEDETKLRSSVKGLDDEEVQFLNYVSNRQMQLEKERSNEEKSLIKEMEAAKVIKLADKTKEQKSSTEKAKASSSTSPSSSSSSSASSSSNTTAAIGKKSQLQLLSGAIKRKSVDKTETEQPAKTLKTADITSTGTEEVERPDSKLMAGISTKSSNNNGIAVVAGVLPGISRYNADDSSTENSSNSSDSEADHMVMPSAITQRVIQEMMKKIKNDCG